jgi:hypothetical protein
MAKMLCLLLLLLRVIFSAMYYTYTHTPPLSRVRLI